MLQRKVQSQITGIGNFKSISYLLRSKIILKFLNYFTIHAAYIVKRGKDISLESFDRLQYHDDATPNVPFFRLRHCIFYRFREPTSLSKSLDFTMLFSKLLTSKFIILVKSAIEFFEAIIISYNIKLLLAYNILLIRKQLVKYYSKYMLRSNLVKLVTYPGNVNWNMIY